MFGKETHLLLLVKVPHVLARDPYGQICPGKKYLPGHIRSLHGHAQFNGGLPQRYAERFQGNADSDVKQGVSPLPLYLLDD